MAEPDVSRRGINRAAPEYAVNSALGYAPFRFSHSGIVRIPSLALAALPRAAWCARESGNRPGDLGGKHLVYFAP
jgi:hypothetical protein